MELRFPIVILIGCIITLLIFFLSSKKKVKFSSGTKIAHTSLIKNTPYYQKKLKKYKLLFRFTKVLCLLSIVLSLFLLARPSKIVTTKNTEYNRDIFLCMDVSTSVDELNLELVQNLKDTVSSLKGERFGISIFNTSSVTLVPLTDDYDYILDTLDHLSEAFQVRIQGDYSRDDYLDQIHYLQSGTLEGNETRGSSLIADGLASCVYSFSNLEEERTRIIILSTDNEPYGTTLLTLEEAAQLMKKKNIILYGIGINNAMTEEEIQEFKKATEITEGIYYNQDSMSVSDIVNNIESTSKSLLESSIEKREQDVPEIPFILLLISSFSFLILCKEVNI
jgi:hypothetical protein